MIIIIGFFFGSITGCCMHRNSLVTKMVLNGTNPMEANVAMRDNYNNRRELMSLIKALSEKNK